MNNDPQLNRNINSMKFSKSDLQFSYTFWLQRYSLKDMDRILEPYLQDFTQPLPGFSWLQHTRTSLWMSADAVAKKTGVTRAAYSQLEQGEKTGRITLQKMALAAEAMDCEVVYAIRPKSKKTYSRLVWDSLLPDLLASAYLRGCDQRRLKITLAHLANNALQVPGFKKRKNAEIETGESNFKLF